MRKLLVVASFVAIASTVACVGEDPGRTDDPIVPGEPTAPAAGESKDMDIHVVRNPSAPNHPAYNTKVTVAGIVTGIKEAGLNHGFFLQDPGEPAWGAIYVYVGANKIEHAPGTKVRVTGYYQAFRGLDQINVTGGTVERLDQAVVPAPLEVDVTEIANGGPRSMELQSVSLLVKGVIATRPTTNVDFTVKGSNGDAELIITSFWANDTNPSPFPATQNQRYASIRGFGTRFGSTDATAVSKLAPISAADVVAE